MKNIKDFTTVPKDMPDYSLEEYRQMEVEATNDITGTLHFEDGITCPICKNKGYIAQLDGKYIVYVDCVCKKQRIIANRLKRCGVSKEMLQHYTFSNYDTTKDYNKAAYDKVIEYCTSLVKGEKNWLYLSGVTGVGKTHLCVAAFQNLIQRGLFTADYMNWNEEIIKLISLSKSYDLKEYETRLKRLQEVELLYIDDFLKLSNLKYSEESLGMAFRIIDARYRNNLVTIISTEYTPYSLAKIDTAIAGRINEKTDFGKYMVNLGEDMSRNYRLNNL